RPPKIPKWPRASGSSTSNGFLIDTIHLVSKCCDFAGVFNPLVRFHAATDVDGKRPHLTYRRGKVSDGQTTGKNNGFGWFIRHQRPVKGLAGTTGHARFIAV